MEKFRKTTVWVVFFVLVSVGVGFAQKANNSALIKQKDVEAHLEFLAGDALNGRGSGTRDELIAAEYLTSMMKQFGVKPAGETDQFGKTTYIQTVQMTRNSFSESPKLSYGTEDAPTVLEYGKDFIIFRINSGKISGQLNKIGVDDELKANAVNLIQLKTEADAEKLQQNFGRLTESKALAILIEETPNFRGGWDRFTSRLPSFSTVSGKTEVSPALVILSKDATENLAKVADGTTIEIGGKIDSEVRKTWNAVGKIEGSDKKLASEVILLSAHLDHLGFRENAPGDDKIYNGADDDASGCVAVLELARILAQGKTPKRSIYFAFFGSEEAGGFGSRYFVDNLPFPKENLVANLQWEMIGRPDALVGKDELWLTGYDRSNLGAELAKQGAKLVNDPHPEQNFFRRSDNYTLARQGIIAHTVSSFGLHKDYHQASDELKTIDFVYMTNAINSMIKPVQWLVNSDFKPTWYEGKKP